VDIGFVGLGHIGGAIAANLVADGHAVSVHDVDGAKQATLVEAGAHGSESIAGVAERSEVTFLSLPTPAIMEQVTLEWLDAAAPGAVLVDLTTNAPATVRELGGRVVASGREFLECPLTGGAPGARMRMLVFICGGEPSTYERVGPLLDALGRARFHLGPLGCGNVGKLVNSLMAFTATWVSLEGLAIGARHDIDLRTLVDMMRTAGATNFFIERMVEGINERGRPPEFALDLAAKDAGLLLDVARDVAVPAPVAGDIAQVMVLAKSMGLGGRDFTDLVEVMERVAGVTLSLPPSA
jgi:3-hydroxyisobutyrate dehydrogenase-like beta-hydroxyacid dehydrogenase